MRKLLILPAACLSLAAPALAMGGTTAEADNSSQTVKGSGSNVSDSGQTAAATRSETIRCKKIEVTGSLARKSKICKTVAEWERISVRENNEARRMLDRNLEGSSTNGN